MDPVTLILAALLAGASAEANDALREGAKEAIEAANVELNELVKERVSGRPQAEVALAEYRAAPEIWERPLAAELTRAGAPQDVNLVSAAQALLELADRPGARSGRYTVTVKDSKGVQVGDGNFQVNKF